MPTNNSTTNNVVFFLVSHLKIVYYNYYQSSISMPWRREEKIFCATNYLETESIFTNPSARAGDDTRSVLSGV